MEVAARWFDPALVVGRWDPELTRFKTICGFETT
jgi:hypothetical protein